MEASIRAQFGDDVLAEALSRWGIEREKVRELDGFESFVYDCGERALIVRISHSLRRTSAQIGAEIDWIDFLAANDLTVCKAVPSKRGELVEVLGTGDEYFTAVVFEKALGAQVATAEWKPPLFERMGRMMGRMHALTKEYVPGHPSFARHHWYEDLVGTAERFLPQSDRVVIDRFNALLTETHELPVERDSYGLVHFDFHRGNFFVHADAIWLFDFDDCQHTWFADDVAIALFYAVPHDCSSAGDREFARSFVGHFLEGYAAENALNRAWLSRIPMFLARREMDLYIVIHRSLDLDNLDPWGASFMRDRGEKIESEVPYVDIDFGSL